MKVKKFDNLWTMGLILSCGILVVVYLAKLIFPKFVIGVAETENIIQIGTYIDTHKWAYYLYHFINSALLLYLYTCACCRISKLDKIESFVILTASALSLVIETFLPQLSFVYNNVLYVLLPFVVYLIKRKCIYDIFFSTSICFIITSYSQALSLEIRNIQYFISNFNTATFFILTIDLYIWSFLLYFYFNNKGGGTM